MLSFDTSLVTAYVYTVVAVAALALVPALAIVANEIVRNRRARLSSHQSVRTYYGSRLALHH